MELFWLIPILPLAGFLLNGLFGRWISERVAGWIASSQHIKPGNLMPSFAVFSGEELQALAEYMASLK